MYEFAFSAMAGRILLVVCLALVGIVHGYTLRDILRERGKDCYFFYKTVVVVIVVHSTQRRKKFASILQIFSSTSLTNYTNRQSQNSIY